VGIQNGTVAYSVDSLFHSEWNLQTHSKFTVNHIV